MVGAKTRLSNLFGTARVAGEASQYRLPPFSIAIGINKDPTMTLQRIIDLVPPPDKPLFSGDSHEWRKILERCKQRLPNSFAEYGRYYGSGEFKGGDVLRIFNPFDPDYDSDISFYCDTYVALREDTPQYYPYACFPEERGIFPIGEGSSRISFWLLPQTSLREFTIVFDDQSRGFVEFIVPCIFDFFYRFMLNQIEERPYFTEPIRFLRRALHKS